MKAILDKNNKVKGYSLKEGVLLEEAEYFKQLTNPGEYTYVDGGFNYAPLPPKSENQKELQNETLTMEKEIRKIEHQERVEDYFLKKIQLDYKNWPLEEVQGLMEVFPEWEDYAQRKNKTFKIGTFINYRGVLYQAIQVHEFEPTLNPLESPDFFKKVLVTPEA